MQQYIYDQIESSYKVKERLLESNELRELIGAVAEKCVAVYKAGGKTLIAGNGGSASDAQHMAGEFVSRFYFDRPGLPSLALTTDSSVLTAIGNDYGYDKIFSRQIQANGRSGDIFIGISTSGNSINVINGIHQAKAMGIITVGLTGEGGGGMDGICDYCIKVPSRETPRIQESHILVGHIICAVVEEAMFGKGFD